MAVYIKSLGDRSFNGRRIVHFGCDSAGDAELIRADAPTTLYDGTLSPVPAPGSTKTVAGGSAAYELNASGSWVSLSGGA